MSNNSGFPKVLANFVRQYLKDIDGFCDKGILGFFNEQVEKTIIEETLKHTKNHQSLCARTLGISRTTLQSKIKKYCINCEQ